MNNIRLNTLFLILFGTFSCVNKDSRDIQFPPGIQAPIDIENSWIEQVELTYLDDTNIIKSIENELSKLKKDSKNFDDKNIKLRCIISYSDGTSSILEGNGFRIKFDGDIYIYSNELMKLLKPTL